MNYISVKEYSEKKKVSVQSIYQRIERGTIDFKKFGSVYLVRE
jgi:predicted DNA-binding protein YlxM (UPF0122 family)